tara:strand:+ start:616 stop:1002 length:387 start_codon:yes stop_codon:yes gene_type:complete
MTFTSLISEDDLQRQVILTLNIKLLPGTLFHHSPNEGMRKVAFKMKLKSMGTRFGWPDLEIFAPAHETVTGKNKTLFIELKLAKGKLSPNQVSIRDSLVSAGFPWALCRSVEEVETFLAAHLKLRATI